VQAELLKLADNDTRKWWDNLTLGYTESLGHPLLREEIARMYKGISASDCLVITPEEGIFIAMNAVLKKGDHIICTFPGYQSLYEIAEAMGCEITKWYPDEKDGWRFDPDFLNLQIKPNTKLIIVNFPHNPTGYLPPKSDFQRIIDIARKHSLYLFSDEMYRYLELNAEDRLPSACENYEKAITLFGMSKTYGMAGARIGWLITRDREMYQKMTVLKDYTTICSSAPSEILSIIALRAKEKIIESHINRININLDLLDGFFSEFKDMFDWVKPRAGTIGFPRITTEADSAEFCLKVVKEANIMILPSTVYDYGNKHFRLGFGRESMPEALKRLSDYLIKI
jgi:aspartate/methionine/tyrosine aminotransferase